MISTERMDIKVLAMNIRSYSGWNILLGATAALLAVLMMFSSTPSTPKSAGVKLQGVYDPCCTYPCQNQGVCMTWPGNRYTCDCTGTNHYGNNCDIPTWSAWLVKKVSPTSESEYNMITSMPRVWAILNSLPFIHKKLMAKVYLSRHDIIDSPPTFGSYHTYKVLDSYFNKSVYGRALPPVPEHCPTPMGIVGPKEYPDVDEVVEKVFKRKQFIPEPHKSNLLFQYYAQHFTHMFFRTNTTSGDGGLTIGENGVDVSNIYGLTEQDRLALRSGIEGKLRVQVIDGQDFPPYLKDVPGYRMNYPPEVPSNHKFALGHPFFGLLPGLFVYATIWIREHNRVCDVLLKIHPDWDDERLYQTARLIITGEVIKITIEDYVQHLSQYNAKIIFDPDITHGSRYQYDNRIHVEFNHLYHWHALVPDNVLVNGSQYKLEDMLFSVAPVMNHGIEEFIRSMANTRAGALTVRNHPDVLLPVVKKLLLEGRALRIQSLNAYRRRFNLRPFKTFEDLTGEKELAGVLQDMYEDIEAVELYVGLMAERPGKSVTPPSVVALGGPWSIKGLIGNPICSPRYWKPSTFGGEVGFNIIKTANFERLFCANMKSKCKDIDIKFTVPETNT